MGRRQVSYACRALERVARRAALGDRRAGHGHVAAGEEPAQKKMVEAGHEHHRPHASNRISPKDLNPETLNPGSRLATAWADTWRHTCGAPALADHGAAWKLPIAARHLHGARHIAAEDARSAPAGSAGAVPDVAPEHQGAHPPPGHPPATNGEQRDRAAPRRKSNSPSRREHRTTARGRQPSLAVLKARGGASQDAAAGDQGRDASGRERSGGGGATAEAAMNPEEVHKEMQETLRRGGSVALSAAERDRLKDTLKRFASRGWAADQALALYINARFFPTAAARFRKFVLRAATPRLRRELLACGPSDAGEELLFPLFAEFCFGAFPDEIRRYRELVRSADMTKPHTWYPFARAMKREIVYHRGPTNSGKTYTALQAFSAAKAGIYCGPLRLLAMEVFDTVNAQGLYCNLVTGQERKEMPFAAHTACTIEMANIMQPFDVAVIDEIQMINDGGRGWAWTRALLGLRADEIHVCGDASALPLLRAMCAATGDRLMEHEYQRFLPLTLDKNSLDGDFANVRPGDCIVAFSRADIFDIKRHVERATEHRCCVVYGALPPETRRQQARLFNEAASGYDVLVASDAVGMGLNLNIGRVVFFSLDKFNGAAKGPIPPPMVKQVAGRAGRRGSRYPEGVVSSFFRRDVADLAHALDHPVEAVTTAGLFPQFEQVELFASQLPEVSFAILLERFAKETRVDGSYFLCRTDNLKKVAAMLDRVRGLSLEDRFYFCFAPANTRDPRSMATLLRYASAYSDSRPVLLGLSAPSEGVTAGDTEELLDLETKHHIVSMYLWLKQHFKVEMFPDAEKADKIAEELARILNVSLARPSSWDADPRPGPVGSADRLLHRGGGRGIQKHRERTSEIPYKTQMPAGEVSSPRFKKLAWPPRGDPVVVRAPHKYA